jgi:hypothetical protein
MTDDTTPKTELIELRPLKPFAGSYKCALSEADVVNDSFAEKEDGQIVKVREPRKRFFGAVSYARHITPAELELSKQGRLPPHLKHEGKSEFVVEHPLQPTVKVPLGIALTLIERQLAERVAA